MSSARSRSSAATDVALDRAATAVASAVRHGRARHPLVLIDGRSGAGKSTLARQVAERLERDRDVQIIALDNLYPGWDGLAEGAELARTGILEPHRRGETGSWRRWDWEAERFAETHPVDAEQTLIVEGSGLLTPAAAALGDVRVWVDAADDVRRQRAFDRDGDTFRPHWHRWAAQEEEHLARHNPRSLASIVVEVP